MRSLRHAECADYYRVRYFLPLAYQSVEKAWFVGVIGWCASLAARFEWKARCGGSSGSTRTTDGQQRGRKAVLLAGAEQFSQDPGEVVRGGS